MTGGTKSRVTSELGAASPAFSVRCAATDLSIQGDTGGLTSAMAVFAGKTEPAKHGPHPWVPLPCPYARLELSPCQPSLQTCHCLLISEAAAVRRRTSSRYSSLRRFTHCTYVRVPSRRRRHYVLSWRAGGQKPRKSGLEPAQKLPEGSTKNRPPPQGGRFVRSVSPLRFPCLRPGRPRLLHLRRRRLGAE